MDPSINLITFALQWAIMQNCSALLEVADCITKTYHDSSFDVIYSRDTIYD